MDIKLKINNVITDDKMINNIKENGKDLISSLNIIDQEIIDNYQMLANVIANNKDCKNCCNKDNCKHSTKGYQYKIVRGKDGLLTDCLVICDFYKKYYQKEANLIYTTFNKEELLDDTNKAFFKDNAKLLGDDFTKKIISLYKNERIKGAFVTFKDSKMRIKLMKSLSANLLANHKLCVVKQTDLLKNIKATFKDSEAKDIFKEVNDCETLIIDGLGNEQVTSWSRDEILYSLLDSRLQNDLTTILCSEYDLESLKKVYKTNYNDEIKAKQLIEKINEINN